MKQDIRIFDTHCHIASSDFTEDLDVVLEKAKKMKIGLVSSSILPDEWKRNIEIARENSHVFPTIGFDPVEIAQCKNTIDWILKNKESLVAIGEVGLDHYRTRDHSERRIQEENFREMIILAKDLSLPIQIHSRSAGKKAIEILTSMDASDVHLHAFDGRASYAMQASKEYGYYFSIPTSVVRSRQKQKLVAAIDIERILVESDSPVLGPDKTVRNDPSNVTIVISEIAKILKREPQEIQSVVLENTMRLYKSIR